MERIGKLGPPKGGWKIERIPPGEPPTPSQVAVLRRHKVRVPATKREALRVIGKLKVSGWQR